MIWLCMVLLGLIAQDCSSQDDEGPYRGKFIGKLNSYHHQVSGDVYAVDEWTLLLVDFNYDGTGDDTFFWAGDAGRPGPQGFIVPDQHGKTNILERYYNEEVRLTLPEGKRISRIKWVSVYDIGSQNAFGDVYVPDEFEAPAPVHIGPLTGPGVSSQPVTIVDAATILIPELKYDGSGNEVYFWCGVGPQPSTKGTKIPDEYGYLEPIRAYKDEDVQLELPGGMTIFDINWVAIYSAGDKQILAAVLVPEGANVPPSPRRWHPHVAALPHCKQLHRDLQVAWEVFGSQITIQLAAMISGDEYIAFGISGSQSASVMSGSDVCVAHYDEHKRQGYANDYNITDMAPCVSVLGAWRGVCRDAAVGGVDDYQMLSAARDAGLTVLTYRRGLQPAESMDKEWPTSGSVSVVWAVGRRGPDGEPTFHTLYPKAHVRIDVAPQPGSGDGDCVPFMIGTRSVPSAWEVASLYDPALRVYIATLAEGGLRRGLWGRRSARPPPPAPAPPAVPYAWHINGQLAPDLQMRRGLTYDFHVYGGNEPHSATLYHPLMISAEPRGGLDTLPEYEQRARRVLAGVHYTRRGRLTPTAAGPLCVGTSPAGVDRRRADTYSTFRAYNRTLKWNCNITAPAVLRVTPNASWPDLVYYHSFTHPDMGGRIFVVDRHRRNVGRVASGGISPSHSHLASLLLAAVSLTMLTVR